MKTKERKSRWDNLLAAPTEIGKSCWKAPCSLHGIGKGMERVNELIRHLIGDGRSEEIGQAVSDREYQNELFVEYGL